MAHGGSSEWDEGVRAAVEPLQERYPIEIALGMADAVSIQAAVDRLEARGVGQISVVRLFISGESWYERTQQILGIAEGAPARPSPAPGSEDAAPGAHGGHSMEFWRISTHATFNLSDTGLADAPAMNAILADRAKALSRDPAVEDVLILAHGPGDDVENEAWLTNISARAEGVRALGFRSVQIETLREDWPEKRVDSEQRIRAFVQAAKDQQGVAIVIPFRVHGFGPYAKVLDDLDYRSDGRGLIPHAGVTLWIEEQITALHAAPFLAKSG